MYRTETENDLVECPFNKTHRILRKRFQAHLFRCRRQHPDVELRKCPFNVIHLITESEYALHVSECPDRKILTQYKYTNKNNDNKEVADIKINPSEDNEENWDDTEAPDFKPMRLLNKVKPKVNLDAEATREDSVQTSYRARNSNRNMSYSPSGSKSRSRSRSPLQREGKSFNPKQTGVKYEMDDDSYYTHK